MFGKLKFSDNSIEKKLMMMHTESVTQKKAVLLIFFLICSFAVFAQEDNLTLKVAVIGPGDELYFWWGHIALIIEDSARGRSLFYDYGLFSFDNENFFYNFAVGRLLYSCGVSPTEINFEVYKNTNRDIIVYTLDLPEETKIKVRDFASINVRPENRDYYYHHFKDNCSTRIRDIIDIAVDGQFAGLYKHEKSRFTLRQHVRRHTWFSPPADWALNFWMGQVIDRPITVWEDMFLPSEVGRLIDGFYYTDINGQRRKLVSSVEIVNRAQNRPIVLETPRTQWPLQTAFSLALSVIFGFFFFLQSRNIRLGRTMAGISMSLCGLVFGFASLLLYFMNIFTNHDYTYENINMVFGTPLLLAAFPFGIGYAAAKSQKKQKKYGELLRIIWLLCALGVIVSMALKLLPMIYQDNLTDQMLLLPIALVFSCQPIGLKETLEKYFPRCLRQKGGASGGL